MKKTGKAAYDEFLADVIGAIPEDQREAIEGVLTSDAVVGKAANRVIQQAEFSRQMDALRAKETEIAEKIKGYEDWYADASGQYATLKEERDAYAEAYGALDPNERPKTPASAGIDEKKLAEELARRDQLAIQFADVLTDLKWDHRQNFNEALNTRELIKFCTEKGLPIEVGYQSFIADRVEAKRKTEFEEKLKAAREEGAREALTRHNLPITPAPSEAHVLDRADIKTDPSERVRAAVESFNRREFHAAR